MLFPADGRQPHLVDLTTTPMTQVDPLTGQEVVVSILPHPEVYMDSPEGELMRKWRVQLISALEGMTLQFEKPYVIFYPLADRIGKPMPVNESVRNIQGQYCSGATEWRGDVIIAKFRGGVGDPFSSLIDISMADFAVLKNYLMRNGPALEQYIQIFYKA